MDFWSSACNGRFEVGAWHTFEGRRITRFELEAWRVLRSARDKRLKVGGWQSFWGRHVTDVLGSMRERRTGGGCMTGVLGSMSDRWTFGGGCIRDVLRSTRDTRFEVNVWHRLEGWRDRCFGVGTWQTDCWRTFWAWLVIDGCFEVSTWHVWRVDAWQMFEGRHVTHVLRLARETFWGWHVTDVLRLTRDK